MVREARSPARGGRSAVATSGRTVPTAAGRSVSPGRRARRRPAVPTTVRGRSAWGAAVAGRSTVSRRGASESCRCHGLGGSPSRDPKKDDRLGEVEKTGPVTSSPTQQARTPASWSKPPTRAKTKNAALCPFVASQLDFNASMTPRFVSAMKYIDAQKPHLNDDPRHDEKDQSERVHEKKEKQREEVRDAPRATAEERRKLRRLAARSREEHADEPDHEERLDHQREELHPAGRARIRIRARPVAGGAEDAVDDAERDEGAEPEDKERPGEDAPSESCKSPTPA